MGFACDLNKPGAPQQGVRIREIVLRQSLSHLPVPRK